MKKATIIIIAVVYVASIVIVGIFGLNALLVNDTIYIESINLPEEIFGKQVKGTAEDKSVTLYYETNAKDDNGNDCMIIDLSYTVTPSNATKRNNINIAIDNSGIGEGDETLVPTLKKGLLGGWTLTLYPNTISVTLRYEATDGRGATTILTVFVRLPKELR